LPEGNALHICVMPGLVPGIHVLLAETKAWMAGTSPAMTEHIEIYGENPVLHR
jgi:hypothetical protein